MQIIQDLQLFCRLLSTVPGDESATEWVCNLGIPRLVLQSTIDQDHGLYRQSYAA
jgi:hypothetical protein